MFAFKSSIFTFVLMNVLSGQQCPPAVQTYCLEGRDGTNSVINGEYVYEGCYSNFPYFRNQNRKNNPLYAFYYDEDTILIGNDYTTSYANAICEQQYIQDCNQNWIVYDDSEWPSQPDSSVYFGSDCIYAHNTLSLCTELTDVSVSVAFDTDNLSGIYQVKGCYDSQPHLLKQTANGNHLFLYYNVDAETYYISDSFGDITDYKATCDLSIYHSISNCLFVASSIDHSVAFTFDINEDPFEYMVYIGLPLSGIFLVVVIIVMVLNSKKATNNSTKQSTEAQITNNSCVQETEHSKKCAFKFVAKCIFVFVIKPIIEAYDYYTDFTLGFIWLNYHGFGTKCPINYDKYAYPLLICSSLGFVIGIIGHIYSVFHSYCVNKRLSYQSLTDLKQKNVNYCVLFKMFVEDIAAIVIFLIVSENEIGITDMEWWFAYYSSCVGFMISAIMLIRKMFPINDKKNILLIGLLVSAPFGLPIYPTGKWEYTGNLQLGFALNDNECQIFENGDGRYLTFDVEDEGLYSIHCGAIFDSSGSSGFEYDYGYYSGLYCTLYEQYSDSILCKFWMFEQQCWTGDCYTYNSNITACFGYIGFE